VARPFFKGSLIKNYQAQFTRLRFFCVIKRVQEDDLRKICLKLMEDHDLLSHGFFIEVNRRAHSYYAACYGDGLNRRIILNIKALEDKDKEFCTSVIKHEISHAIDFIRSGYKWRYMTTTTGKKRHLVHDKVWKNICKEIGVSDSMYL
jgi:hypothetical protein